MGKFPYDITRVSEDTLKKLNSLYGPGGRIADHIIPEIGLRMPGDYAEVASRIYNLSVKPDDIWLVTFPKCGTTWTQSIVWNLITNCDETTKDIPMQKKFPFVELQCVGKSPFSDNLTEEEIEMMSENDRMTHDRHTKSVEIAENLNSSPRLLKSHLPFQVLPPDLLDSAKVIYVARRPWDACASFHNHQVEAFPFMYEYQGDLTQFAAMFRQEENIYGSYWNHLKTAWSQRDHPNLHFVWYEDMKADFDSELARMQKFLGTKVQGEKLDELRRRVNIKTMQADAAKQGGKSLGEGRRKFYQRNGRVGGLKAALGEDQQEVDLWRQWAKEKVEETGIDMDIPDC